MLAVLKDMGLIPAQSKLTAGKKLTLVVLPAVITGLRKHNLEGKKCSQYNMPAAGNHFLCFVGSPPDFRQHGSKQFFGRLIEFRIYVKVEK